MPTIRRNNLKAVRALLESAALVTEYSYDDMDTETSKGRASVEQIMALAPRWRSVTTEHITMHGNWFFTVYQTVEDARRRLTTKAFERYFGAEQVAA